MGLLVAGQQPGKNNKREIEYREFITSVFRFYFSLELVMNILGEIYFTFKNILIWLLWKFFKCFGVFF